MENKQAKWWQKAVIYQIYPRSFYDSNADGIGDLQGIIQKLPYLQELGIDAIWLSPVFRSPQDDNGYDISDYQDIDPIFGKLEDMDELIAEAKKRGIRIIMDLVLNHSSDEHPWFLEAKKSKDNPYHDFYVWRDGVEGKYPNDLKAAFCGPAWEWVPECGQYYLHQFSVKQPDLNWENPEVREELKKVILFWKEKGIRGFRFDVVNLISKPEVWEDDWEGDGRRFYTDGRHVHEFLKELTADTGIGDLVTVGEMSSTSLENCIRYSNPEEKELSMCFSFHHLKVDYKDGNKWELMEPDLGELKSILKKWQLGM